MYVKRIITITLVLLMLMTLCSCSSVITEGEVYEKEYREPFTTVMTYPMVISNGKTTTTVIVPYVVHYPERFVIHIKSFVDDEWLTEDFYVKKEVYDVINIGDMFKFDDGRGDLKDEPYTREKEKK